MVKHDTLLICSPTREKRQDLRRVFADTYNLLESGDISQLLLLLKQNQGCIAAVLLDIGNMDPEERDRIVQEENRSLLGKLPVIVLSPGDTPELLNHAFQLGAADVIPAGYDPYAMLRRVENIVDLHLHKQHLEIMVAEQQQRLQQFSDAMVDTLSSIVEYRSTETGKHILRIRQFTRILLEEVARCCPEYQLTEATINIICSASALHDIGKIAIPDEILMKAGPLTEQEWEIMKTHAATGSRIIETMEHMADREYLRYAHNICHYHHERWDGGGYPEGLQGDAIPICAQVVGLTDAYEALTSKRVYKEAFSFSKAVNMIFRGDCGVFSPKLLECFKHVVHRFEALAKAYADGKIPERKGFLSEEPLPELQETEDAMEQLQGKYFALIHYINGVLIELDMDRQLFHLIYNPYPELASIQEMDTLEEIGNLLCNRFVHPEDREKMEWFLEQEIQRFLEAGLRRVSHYIRFNSRTEPGGAVFELTLLRINPQDHSQRTVAVLARKIAPAESGVRETIQAPVPAGGTFLCENDAQFTLLEMNCPTGLLAGYTAEEIKDQMGNKLLELVYPEDRAMVRQGFTRQLRTGSAVGLEHRICRKDGSVRWVYNNSQLITNAAGQEVLYCYLLDIQDLRREDTALQEKLQRYEMILAQTENVLFEWDVVQDFIRFSDTWEKLFGYQPGGSDRWSQQWMSCLHPDDMPLLADCISRLKNGSPYEMTEIRMVTAQSRYLWCRFRATALRNARGDLQKISGIIINIDSEKQEEQALQSRAEQDSLTKLLNKDAARKQAEDYFLRFSSDVGGALLIIDMDDFKQINDRKGHLFGDSVLVKVAQEIRKLFRGQDIVARIGGDEFMVVMRGVTDENLLEQRCYQLIQIFRESFRNYNLSLTCSIGISLAPMHGQSYYELFRHADQALYRAKAKGKNCYAIYSPDDADYLNQGRTGTVRNPIDSDTQPGMANDTVVRYAFQKLYSSQNVERSINELLGFIGEKLNVSRVYVFENSEDNRFCNNTYEWCNSGIPSEIRNLQNISYETDIPGYADNFDEDGIFYCPDVAILPKNVYDLVAPQGIKAMLHCAIRENGVFRGYIGFDDCMEPRMWTKDQIELLQFFSESLSIFLLQLRRQEKLQRQAEELRFILDNQNAWSYVVDPNTHELLYLNARLKEKFPEVRMGRLCHQLLENRETPCAGCPMERLEGKTNYSCLQNIGKRHNMLMEAARIRWNGTQAVLISGRELPVTDGQQ